MKKLFMLSFLIGAVALSADASANYVYQNGYQKSNGTYVQGHYKTRADNTKLNNRSCYEKGRCY
jgi:hypothetical protein